MSHTGYDKVKANRAQAAERRGVAFDWDEEFYYCPTCGMEFDHFEHMKEETTTLDGIKSGRTEALHPNRCRPKNNLADYIPGIVQPRPVELELKVVGVGLDMFDLAAFPALGEKKTTVEGKAVVEITSDVSESEVEVKEAESDVDEALISFLNKHKTASEVDEPTEEVKENVIESVDDIMVEYFVPPKVEKSKKSRKMQGYKKVATRITPMVTVAPHIPAGKITVQQDAQPLKKPEKVVTTVIPKMQQVWKAKDKTTYETGECSNEHKDNKISETVKPTIETTEASVDKKNTDFVFIDTSAPGALGVVSQAFMGYQGVKYLYQEGPEILNSLKSTGGKILHYVDHALRTTKIKLQNMADVSVFAKRYKRTFYNDDETAPNIHYYNLLGATSCGLTYEPLFKRFGCPHCHTHGETVDEVLSKMATETHKHFCKPQMTTRTTMTKHEPEGVKYVQHENARTEATLNNYVVPKRSIQIGSFVVDLDQPAEAPASIRKAEEALTGERVVITSSFTIGTPERKNNSIKKTLKRSRSLDRSLKLLDDEVVTKATFDDSPIIGKNAQFIDLLEDERDKVTVEEIAAPKPTGLMRFFKRKPEAKVVARCEYKVNDLVKQTLQLGMRTGIPIIYIDKRKPVVKKNKAVYRVPLVHFYDPASGASDDIQDSVLREILESEYMAQQVASKPGTFISTNIKVGWSGALIAKSNALDPEKFEWNEHGLCVVKGRGVNGNILNALNEHNPNEIAEYYSVREFVQERTAEYNSKLNLDHEPDNTGAGITTMTTFASQFWKSRHIGCTKCWSKPIDTDMMNDWIATLASMRRLEGSSSHHFAQVLEQLMQQQRGSDVRDFFQSNYDPRIQALVDLIKSHYSTLELVNQSLHNLSERLNAREQREIAQACRDQISTKILAHGTKMHDELQSLVAHLSVKEQETRQHFPGNFRKLNLDTMTDENGNMRVHGDFKFLDMILRTQQVSTEIRVSDIHNHVWKWGSTGPLGTQKLRTCAALAFDAESSDLDGFKRTGVSRNQDHQSCESTIIGSTKLCCYGFGNYRYETGRIMPMLNQVRYGNISSGQTLTFDFERNGVIRLVNEGYCYINCFIAMIQFVPPEKAEYFVTAAIPTVVKRLGKWPSFKALSYAIFDVVAKIPSVCEAPVPVIVVDHTQKLMHMVGQMGLNDYNLHQLNLQTVQEWFDISSFISDSHFGEYKIGGLTQDIVKSLKSRTHFEDLVRNKPNILVEALLSPSCVHALFLANQKHKLVEQLIESEESLLKLLARLNTLGRHYSLYESVEEVMHQFVDDNITFKTPLREVFGDAVADDFANRMNSIIIAKLEMNKIDKLERVIEKKLDVVAQEQDMRESVVACLKEGLSFADYYKIRLSHVATKYRTNINLSIITSKSWSIRYKIQDKVDKAKSWMWTKVFTTASGTSYWVLKKTINQLMPYYAMFTVLVFIASMVLKAIKWTRAIKIEKDIKSVHFESKPKTGANVAKFMAVAAVITALFNADLSDQWYSCMMKFKNIMSTVFDSNSLHFEAEPSEEDALDLDPVKFIEFALQEEDDPIVMARQTTFSEWKRAKEQMNLIGYIPRNQGVRMNLDAKINNLGAVAGKIHESDNTEFLVVGKVGCGKSTKFVKSLMANGRVLLCEPTRALVTNVEEGINKICGVDPSVKMRFYNRHGTSPVTIMTHGFALNWFANGCGNVEEYTYVVFDECHQLQSAMIVFYNWMKINHPTVKLIKMSATPPNLVTKFEPEHPVEVADFGRMDIKSFADQQGTKTLADMTQHGRVILVFVASYSDVDTLSNWLRNKGFGVVKADGRTLRNTPNLSEKIAQQKQTHVFVVATNAVENGVTLDVDVVFDFGEKITGMLDSEARYIGTTRVKINLAERTQRFGRVGRYKPGFAARVGSIQAGTDDIDPLLATSTALLSYAYNVPPCLINVDVDLIGNLTKEQVQTASQFEIDELYLAHFVRPDGKMPKAIYDEFKHLLLRDTKINVSDKYASSILSNRWHTVEHYRRCGRTRCEDNSRVPLPFHSHTISDEAVTRISYAMKSSDPGRGVGIGIPTDKLYEAVHRITYSENTVSGILAVVEALIHREEEKLQTLRESNSIVSSFSLLEICNLKYLATKSRKERRCQENITKLTNIEQSLKSMPPNLTNAELLNFLRENPLTTQSVLYEGDIKQHIDEQILGNKPINLKVVAIPCLLGLIGLGAYVIYNRLSAINDSVHYEGKQKRLKFNRDKRGAAFYADRESDWADTFGMAYSKKVPKSRKHEVTPLGSKTHPFTNTYDFDMDAFDFVKFVDPNTKLYVERTTYGLDVEEVRDTLEQGAADLQDVVYDPADPSFKTDELHAYFYKTGQRDGILVKMTPHNPRVVSKKNNLLPVGYPEREGEFRQTGAPIRVSVDEMKAAGIPMTGGEVEFEGSASVPAPVSYDHFKYYVVLLDNDHMKICGFGFDKWICTPGHFHGKQDAKKKDLSIYSVYGDFKFKDGGKRRFLQVDDYDCSVFAIPFDAPKFRKKLSMREPIDGESVQMITPSKSPTGITLKISLPTRAMKGPDSGHLWFHGISTQLGSCGSLLISTQDQAVVGYHTMGFDVKNGFSVFTPITQKLISLLNATTLEMPHFFFDETKLNLGKLKLSNGTVNKFPISRSIQQVLSFEGEVKGTKYCCNNLRQIGQIERPLNLRHTIRGVRQEYLNFLHERPEYSWAITNLGSRMPSVLSIDAFYLDLLKYDQPIGVGAIDELADIMAYNRTVKILEEAGYVKKSLPYIWDACDVVADMNKNAAMGAIYQGKKKDWLKHLTPDDVQEAHRESMANLFYGRMGLWTGSLKAELRPASKVLQKKTRVFTAAPIDVLLGAKSLVDAFNHQFYALNLKGPWTVGINKFNGGWENLHDYFNHEWMFIDADGSQFDSSLVPYLFSQICKMRCEFMEDCELGEPAIKNLYGQIVYTPVSTIDGNIVRKFKGNNSGQPSTVVDNTLALMFVTEYARSYIENTLHKKMRFKFVANGDDLLLNLPPDEVPIVQKHFSDLYLAYGLKYQFNDVHKTIYTVEYMSNRFVKYRNRVIPKLSKERILAIAEWERNDDVEAQISALNAARIEAWGYDDIYPLVDDFIMHFAKERCLDKYMYLPEEFIEWLYLSTKEELFRNLELAQNSLHFEAQFSEREPMEQTTPGYVGPREGETQAEKEAREATNKQNYETAHRAWEDRKKKWEAEHMSDGGGGQETDIPPTDGETSQFRLPKMKKKTVWVPPAMKSLVTQRSVKQMLAYTPDQMLMRSDVAMQETLIAWKRGIIADLEISEQDFGTILQSFIVWCINSGTSKEVLTKEKWQADDGNGNVETYPLKPFVEHAGESLRSVMRNFSSIAEAWIKEKNTHGTWISAWAQKAGLTDKQYAHVGFDFWVGDGNTPNAVANYHGLMTAAHIHKAQPKSLAMSTLNRQEGGEPDYHVSTDVAPGRHNVRGASLA